MNVPISVQHLEKTVLKHLKKTSFIFLFCPIFLTAETLSVSSAIFLCCYCKTINHVVSALCISLAQPFSLKALCVLLLKIYASKLSHYDFYVAIFCNFRGRDKPGYDSWKIYVIFNAKQSRDLHY